MPAPQIISELVERFKFNINDYKQGSYNETQVRREFIDPFFKALGWDISNEKGYAEAYKDVVHEYSLKTKDKAEAPDYLFRIGGTKKFFVEAKKPSVNLRDDISPAFQLRRYAWSAKLPLSILTDFEELVIYDCRIQPKKTDKSSTGRIKYFTYEEYIDKWDEIESIFSREAVLKGSFDKYAESNKGKRGTAEVDDAFLKEIENWREILARNIALRNEHLSNRELNFAVQKTIDRIIFLRICEDRGIEDYGQLMNLQNGANVYQRLLQIFTRADEKYNSGLFHFEDEKNRNEEPDKITPAISIDDKVLKEIIKNLYYPDSPYEFSVLPSDILGHVYEQFLGKVIRLTAGHRAVIEEKPEVKKAGGVYYTPTYIVDYIVKNTLGKKLEEIEAKIKPGNDASIKKALKEASELKVLDPACGSGSFLIGAYQYLLDWHLKLYSVETSLRVGTVSLQRNSPVYQTKDGDYRLTTSEKKRILLNNIYGVDIDSQAVEVTKLSLLLKVLEGETDESLFTQISLFRQRALPDLSSNIKCGNSLIGPDFYNQTELNLDEEEHYRINVFDWNEEFKEIMNDGGFDCVIGNPPWGANLEQYEKDFLKDNYDSFGGNFDTYIFFIEKSLKLSHLNGIVSLITPDTWISVPQSKNLRKMVLTSFGLHLITILPQKVFKNVSANCIVFSISNDDSGNKVTINISNPSASLIELLSNDFEKSYDVSTDHWLQNDEIQFLIYHDDEKLKIINKIMDSSLRGSEVLDVMQGIVPYSKESHSQQVIKERGFHSKLSKDENSGQWIQGRAIKRFELHFTTKEYLNYGKWLHRPRKPKYFIGERILIQEITGGNPPRINATMYTDKLYHDPGIISCLNKSDYPTEFLLGIINSKLMSWLHNITSPKGKRKTFPKVLIRDIRNFPFPSVDPTDEQTTNIIRLVISLMDLKKQLHNPKTPQEKKNLERQIAALDKQIDQLVYELYGLTEDEIKIVEESVK